MMGMYLLRYTPIGRVKTSAITVNCDDENPHGSSSSFLSISPGVVLPSILKSISKFDNGLGFEVDESQ